MSRRIVYTPLALNDLEEIFDYITQDNPKAAARVADEMRKTIALLSDFPFMGRTINEVGLNGHRALATGNHLVFYTVSTDEIQIRRVLHGARKYEGLLEAEEIREAGCDDEVKP